MTTKIKKLIRNECANYYMGDCIEKNCECVGHSLRCKYFEKCVLPLDLELQEEYRSIHKIMEYEKNVKICQLCGDLFRTFHNRRIYCEKCRKIAQKNKVKMRVRKKRNSM
jgi:hypothetical protein